MFDHCRENHFYNKDMHKYNYGNHSNYYQKDANHYDRKNYFCQDYTSYSNANSYDNSCQPTFKNSNFLKILMRINPIPLIHLLFLKIHLLTLDHLIFIILPIVTKLIILFWSL